MLLSHDGTNFIIQTASGGVGHCSSPFLTNVWSVEQWATEKLTICNLTTLKITKLAHAFDASMTTLREETKSYLISHFVL